MPVLPAVGNVLKMVLRGYVDGLLQDVWENVLHWRWSGTTPTSNDLDTIAGQASTFWQSQMAPECPSPTTLRNIECIDLSNNTGAGGEWNGVLSGTRGDDSIPANAAALISYPIDLRYRGGHPRTYLYVGGNADLQGASEWSTAFHTEFGQHWNTFLTLTGQATAGGCSLAGLVAVLYHGHGGPYITGTLRTSPIVVPLDFANSIPQLEIASQRRRTAKKGSTTLALKNARAQQLGRFQAEV
jgi:hypothetical protein